MKKSHYVTFSILVFCVCMLLPMQSRAAQYKQEEIDSRAEERYEELNNKMENLYYNAMNSIEDNILDEDQEKSLGERVFIHFYRIYSFIKSSVPYLVSFSILFGTFTCALIKRNKFLFRKIFVSFILLIPIGMLMFYFIVGALIG